jgi:hypothetical protein
VLGCMQDMLSKVATLVGGVVEKRCRLRPQSRQTVQRCGARDLKSTASFSENPTSRGVQHSARLRMREDASRTTNHHACYATAMIWCKPSGPSTNSWTFVHQHRPGRYAGRFVQAHSGTPPSNESNLSRTATAPDLLLLLPLAPK